MLQIGKIRAEDEDLNRLSDIDRQRLTLIYATLNELKIKFPNAEIERKTGHDASNISSYLKAKKPLSENFYNDFVKHFCPEKTQSFQQKLLDRKNGSNPKQVPMYSGFTTLGNIEVIDDENVKHKVMAHLPAEVFPGCDYAEKAHGDSMHPVIQNQAVVAGKVCPVKGIVFGEKYIVKTRDGMDTVKYIHPGSNERMLKLKAYNKSVPDQEIEIEAMIYYFTPDKMNNLRGGKTIFKKQSPNCNKFDWIGCRAASKLPFNYRGELHYKPANSPPKRML